MAISKKKVDENDLTTWPVKKLKAQALSLYSAIFQAECFGSHDLRDYDAMGKIYNAPKEFKKPDYAKYQNFDNYFKACEKYIEDIKAWAKQANPNCPESGKEITFPVGDGQARYIVVSLKPVILVHDDTGDAWHYQYAHRLTAADVRKEVKNLEGLNKLFGTRMAP